MNGNSMIITADGISEGTLNADDSITIQALVEEGVEETMYPSTARTLVEKADGLIAQSQAAGTIDYELKGIEAALREKVAADGGHVFRFCVYRNGDHGITGTALSLKADLEMKNIEIVTHRFHNLSGWYFESFNVLGTDDEMALLLSLVESAKAGREIKRGK